MKSIKIVRQDFSFAWLFMLMACTTSEEKIIDPGQPIHQDDFEYVVNTFSIQNNIESSKDTLIANGQYYLISFTVINTAKRVNHRWKNTIAYVMDENGNKYENNKDAQVVLNSIKPFGYEAEYVTTFQTEESTIFIFDLPEDVHKPYLMVRGETLMGDFFDGDQFSKTKVKLF